MEVGKVGPCEDAKDVPVAKEVHASTLCGGASGVEGTDGIGVQCAGREGVSLWTCPELV